MQHGFDPRPAARAFWDKVDKPEPFPRRLRGAIAGTLPVAVISLPSLTLSAAAGWLERRGAPFSHAFKDRPVRGFLVAQYGHGFIFLDGTMGADEERFTLAHETAHFIHHYQLPRSTALAVLGEQIRPVLDGERPPSVQERLMSALREATIGTFIHALERSENGLPDGDTLRLEVEADLIGFELLAPSDRVAAMTSQGAGCRDALQHTYGLPPAAAMAWSGWIDARRAPDAFIARLEDHRRKIRA